MVENRLEKTSSRLKQCIKGDDTNADSSKNFWKPASGTEVLLVQFYMQNSLSVQGWKYSNFLLVISILLSHVNVI